MAAQKLHRMTRGMGARADRAHVKRLKRRCTICWSQPERCQCFRPGWPGGTRPVDSGLHLQHDLDPNRCGLCDQQVASWWDRCPGPAEPAADQPDDKPAPFVFDGFDE